MKFACALLAACVLAHPAFGADLPLRGIAPALPPSFGTISWTGTYLGVKGSYALSQNKLTAMAFFGPVEAGADPDAAGAGAQIGYRTQHANGVVTGVEGDAFWLAGVSRRAEYFSPVVGATGVNGSNRLNWDASVRVSLGYALGSLLPFVTGGVAFIDEQGCSMNAGTRICGTGTGFSQIRTGWTVGAGVAYRLTPSWIASAEYRYADFGARTYTTPGVGLGTTRSELKTHKVLAGLSYRFDDAAGASIARY